MRTVRVKLNSNSYNIQIGAGLLRQTELRLKESGFEGKLVIITDPTVKGLYGNSLKQSLAKSGFQVSILEIPEGEEQKSLENVGKLYRELTGLYVERSTPIIALGGGVIGDLAGFVAATYLRGLPLIQIPTTLLAQVDSSIGGKVAVDFGPLKNKIGAFYQPRLVIADIDALTTLISGQFIDGLAEVIKYGVIADPELFAYIEKNLDKIKALDAKALETIVFRSAKIKAEIVEKDERDLGPRNVLNYGHTIGHAIESVSNFSVRHGEAVAIGMLAAARIANKMDLFDKKELKRLKAVITHAGLPTKFPALEREKLLQAMKHDKKIVQGKVRFVLPKAIGNVFITDEVSFSLIEEALVEKE
ncbi:MAG: 3-dehydroquinate synthase [Chloroflexota bacterium]